MARTRPGPGLDQPVWYVAYGSNLAASRLRCYLAGGRPTGALRAQPGARDPRPHTGDRAVALPHPVRFGGESRTWGGGVAWLDPDRDGHAHGRAWRLRLGQFADLVAQENDLDPGHVTLDPQLVGSVSLHLADLRYGRVVPLPPIDGEPAVTLTRTLAPTHAAPGAAYRRMLADGLRELGHDDPAALVAATVRADRAGWTSTSDV